MVVLVSAVYLNFLGSVAYICSTLEYDGLLSYKRLCSTTQHRAVALSSFSISSLFLNYDTIFQTLFLKTLLNNDGLPSN